MAANEMGLCSYSTSNGARLTRLLVIADMAQRVPHYFVGETKVLWTFTDVALPSAPLTFFLLQPTDLHVVFPGVALEKVLLCAKAKRMSAVSRHLRFPCEQAGICVPRLRTCYPHKPNAAIPTLSPCRLSQSESPADILEGNQYIFINRGTTLVSAISAGLLLSVVRTSLGLYSKLHPSTLYSHHSTSTPILRQRTPWRTSMRLTLRNTLDIR
ncbi:hypothetical protein H4582DRAFT_1940606 [Lactarius indigo]|nr:hypothetical protein H4582DRAFT_1940606 [Lactarius indigo]